MYMIEYDEHALLHCVMYHGFVQTLEMIHSHYTNVANVVL